MGRLRDIYEAVSDALDTINPFTDKEADRELYEFLADLRDDEIENLIMRRDFAKRGYKHTEGPKLRSSFRSLLSGKSSLTIETVIPAFEQASWTPKQRALAVKEITNELKRHGLSDEDIEHRVRRGTRAVKHVIIDGRNGSYNR